MDSVANVHETFRRRLSEGDLPDTESRITALSPTEAVEVFRAQCLSRNLDRISREMQKQGQGYYTIGSSGHEGMAAVASALRPTDMSFLHYRDGAFLTRRAAQVPGQTPTWDMLLSFACSSEDPISGGRHKVLGSHALMVPPQTSTIASHLPKSVGAAFSIGLARRYKPRHQVLANDSIVMCSFGDASSNHSTATGAINSACWTSFQNLPMPLLFVCEDNGIGISVRTPTGWVAANYGNRPGLRYFSANGLDIDETYRVAGEAASYVRTHRKPAFLHLSLVRLYGHAGSDAESGYLTNAEIEAQEKSDPLLFSATLLVRSRILSEAQALEIYDQIDDQCRRVVEDAICRPRLGSSQEVMASLVPPARSVDKENEISAEKRTQIFGSDARAMNQPQTMSRLISWTLTDLMMSHREIIVAGEDVGRKGGVYGVTQKLQQRFGPDRVIDSLLDEQSILGLAIGLAHNGFIPVPEIQFLAYLHNAEDQLRGEAATLSFFSNGQYTNPMVVRIAGLGYQRGFGGHFHNDNSLGVLRDIPGLIVACPSNGADAPGMLRECLRLAREEQRVVVFVEPIALYNMRDLHEEGDGDWMNNYPAPSERIPIGNIGIHGQGKDIAVVSYANGYYLSRQAEHLLREQHGVDASVVDLRWLSPLPVEQLVSAVEDCSHILIVDECRRTGNLSESLVSLLHEHCSVNIGRLAAEDSFIATGPAYAATMPSRDQIVATVLAMLGKR